MDPAANPQPIATPTSTPIPPANASQSRKSMYLIAGIIVSLVICLILSFLLLSQIISF